MNHRRLILGVAGVCLFQWAGAEVKPGTPAVTVQNVFSVEDFKGRVVYLDFWASWCTPCALSFPWMQSMLDQHGDRGLAVVAVNLDEDRAAADRFLKKQAPTFSVAYDPKGVSAEAYGVPGMPTSFLIDRNGVVRYTHVGFSKTKAVEYEKEIAVLLEESVHVKE